MRLLSRLHKYIPIIGILLFLFILWRIGISDILNSLVRVKIIFLIIFILFMIPIISIQVFKWYYIIRVQGIKISFFESFKFHMVSSFLGSITPGRVGLLSKIFFLKRNTKKSIGECASSVILDKLFDLIILFIFGFLGSLLLLKKHDLNLLLGLFLIIFVIGIFFLLNRKIARFFLKWIYRYFIPKKFKETARLNFNNFYESIPRLKKLITPFLITSLSWILLYTQAYILAYGFDIKVPYVYFICIISIVTLITLLPITILGVGTRELSLIALFSSFGVNNSSLIAFSIVTAFLAPLILFIGYMLYAKDVSQNIKNEQEKIN